VAVAVAVAVTAEEVVVVVGRDLAHAGPAATPVVARATQAPSRSLPALVAKLAVRTALASS
jgi:hypothetical protein